MGSYRIHELDNRIFINFSGSMDLLVGFWYILTDLWTDLIGSYQILIKLKIKQN